MQVREKCELRSKKSQETTKPKDSEATIKKRPEKTSKTTAETKKSAAESSGENREKDNQNTNAQGKPATLALQLVLLIKLSQTLYIMRVITLT